MVLNLKNSNLFLCYSQKSMLEANNGHDHFMSLFLHADPKLRRSFDPWDSSSLPLIRSQLVFSPAANLPAPFIPLYPAPQAHLLVPNEVPNHPCPTSVMRQSRIIVLGHLVQCRQTCPGYRWEIVVLVVQTHVVGKHVQWSVIREGLWNRHEVVGFFCAFRLWVEHIMLGDEMACTRMQRAGQKRAHDQVCQGSATCVPQEKVIEG